MPEVSVVVPTRNRRDLLRHTLGCVLGQRAVDIEVLVADDGSTDGTPEVVRSLGDPRVRLLRSHSSAGPGVARNRGIAAAAAAWVAFIDDDDLWAPDKLRRQLDAATSTRAEWVYTGAVNVQQRDGRLEIVGGAPCSSPDEVRARLPYRNALGGGPALVLVRRALLDRVGGFDGSLPHKEDWDLWIRLSRAAAPAVVPAPLVAYRIHDDQRSVAVAGTLAAARTISERYAALRGGRPIDWAGVHRHLAWLCLRAGRRAPALLAYLGAVRHGDLGSLGRAAGLLSPGAVARAHRPRRVEPAWRAAAEAWIEAVPVGPAA